MLTHVSLFTGIGGLDLAAEAAGFETVLQVEREPYALKILERHWPEVPRITDVRDVHADSVTGPVTVVSGGFPCQPFSAAGKRRGTDDDRYLWPELLRIVDELQPAWVVGENVSGLLSIDGGLEIERMLTSLEARDYEIVGVLHYPAASVGAYHKRDRVFIVANTQRATIPKKPDWWKKRKHQDRPEIRPLDSAGGKAMANAEIRGRREGHPHSGGAREGAGATRERRRPSDSGCGQDVADAKNSGDVRRNGKLGATEKEHHDRRGAEDGCREWRPTESIMGGMADGLPDWMDKEPAGVPRVATGIKDRAARLKTLGNAVVPAQAYPIFASIAHAEQSRI